MIQKFCYHGNVTSHFSSLFSYAFRLTDVDFFRELHIQTLSKRMYLSHTLWVLTRKPWPQYLLTPCVKISQLPLFAFVNLVNPSMFAAIIIFSHKLCNADQCRPNPEGASLGSKALVSKTKQLHPVTPRNCQKCTIPRMFLRLPRDFPGGVPWLFFRGSQYFLRETGAERNIEVRRETRLTVYRRAGLCYFSKIQLVVYYQCCVLTGWATTRLYVIAH